ncbi:AbrB/MazE/SpoVT family DNA-binding domain-containing protein [Salinibacillus xinjiangensis]|uniref:AbrB/MazE/SpoVT family DNA-binding domain-containing protein n=1 Tax=Salinibacillus xinjiangensis TaxID=1229268 RepID=A0A6G1X3U1_9BACI|nr:AbrB/MazE/SpoVT family DNA-binding domain-containing protein [Salinibacillus xinjiangensis]MRG85663.1 AbrB/MazE/SpoVT family DNA-binding domain-containing protein [Salinibacillus xinjiangensis]
MKASGLVRKVDELGRIVIPIELRRTMDINIKDPIEIFVDDDMIVLKKFRSQDSCVICSNVKDTVEIKGKKVCHECAEEIQQLSQPQEV